MCKVIWHVIMSLDGFITGSDHTTSWTFRYTLDNPPEAEQVLASTGAVLGGRRGYDLGRKTRQSADFCGQKDSWRGPVFVLTHHSPSDERDPAVTFLCGSIRKSVETALEAARGKNLLILGADIARQCLNEKLVDEIVVHIAPVLLGDGTRIFERSGTPVRLETISVSRSGPLTTLRLRVAK